MATVYLTVHEDMDTFDNIQHDLSDATFSVTTAIELLSGIEQDKGKANAVLHELIEKLTEVRHHLDDAHERVTEVRREVAV